MTSFAEQLRTFSSKVERREAEVFVGTVLAVHESIQDGSPVTGAPGQPVDQGVLRASWHTTFESERSALVSTNAAHAPPIEDQIGPHGKLTLRSARGGFHSVKLTRAGFSRLVASVRAKIR